jgi:hypothetical protein
MPELFDTPIRDWFELSYAQFLTVPRLVMEAMLYAWQQQMAQLLYELDATFDWRPTEGRYWVKLRDAHGRFTDAPLDDYRRGSCEHLRRVPLNAPDAEFDAGSSDDIPALRAEIARLNSWDGMMSILDKHYPESVFDGSSGDDGPRMIVMLRLIDKPRAEVEHLRRVPLVTEDDAYDLTHTMHAR